MTNEDDEYEQCERCGKDVIPGSRVTVEIDDSYKVCISCAEALIGEIELYDWQDRYTEEQHERALSLLSGRDEIDCVISDYDIGHIIVHTDYVSSDVIKDFCEHFGFSIKSFGPVWENETDIPCISDHGSTFEVVLQYGYQSDMPIPTQFKFEEMYVDRLDENDEQF